jgi:hypothetical protein
MNIVEKYLIVSEERNNLISRFIIHGNDMPDIDIDFSAERHSHMIQTVFGHYSVMGGSLNRELNISDVFKKALDKLLEEE